MSCPVQGHSDDSLLFAASGGREERRFPTWQGRLPQELRLHSITTVEAANEFLRTHYFAEFNGRFAVQPREIRKRLIRSTRKDLDWVFSIQHERTVNPDNTVVVDNRVLQIQKTKWRNTLAVHGHRASVARWSSGRALRSA